MSLLINSPTLFPSFIILVVMEGRGKKMGKTTRLSINIIKERVKITAPQLEIRSEDYQNRDTPILVHCTIDNHTWWSDWVSLRIIKGCSKCQSRKLAERNAKITDENRLSTIRPDLIKYFQTPEDANNFTVKSCKHYTFICDQCGTPKDMAIGTLSTYGLGCTICGDGVSVPEKFMMNVFKQIKLQFNAQKIFEWEKSNRYDFYIPDLEMIIEVHGRQHYEESTRGNSLEYEITNDKNKYDCACSNGISKYIAIDCRYSKLNWMKDNIIHQLKDYFDLTNVDWEVAFEESQKSYMILACELYNSGKEVTEIMEILNMSRSGICIYLNYGNSIGKCNYVGKKKSVQQFDKDGSFIDEYKSITEASKLTGVFLNSISMACMGKYKYAGGFTWRYSE